MKQLVTSGRVNLKSALRAICSTKQEVGEPIDAISLQTTEPRSFIAPSSLLVVYPADRASEAPSVRARFAQFLGEFLEKNHSGNGLLPTGDHPAGDLGV